jgi:hypothetical protein
VCVSTRRVVSTGSAWRLDIWMIGQLWDDGFAHAYAQGKRLLVCEKKMDMSRGCDPNVKRGGFQGFMDICDHCKRISPSFSQRSLKLLQGRINQNNPSASVGIMVQSKSYKAGPYLFFVSSLLMLQTTAFLMIESARLDWHLIQYDCALDALHSFRRRATRLVDRTLTAGDGIAMFANHLSRSGSSTSYRDYTSDTCHRP